MEIGTRERIIEHAAWQFLDNGIKNITMDELAEQLGMSKRTIYEFFKDKKELVMESMNFLTKKRSAIHKEVYETAENSFDALLKLYKANQEGLIKISRKFADDLKKYFPEANQNREESKKKIHDGLLITFQKAMDEGFILKSLNPSVLSYLLTEEIFYILDENQFKDKLKFMEIYETMCLTFFRGIATNKGREIINRYFDENKQEEKL